MAKIEVFKNEKIEFCKEVLEKSNLLLFETSSFDINKLILIRDDSEYNFELNFTTSKGIIFLKNEKISFDLPIKIYQKEISDKIIKITYNIESDENAITTLKITL